MKNTTTHKLNLGQHFLNNKQIVDKMIAYTSPSKNETILEIGGGEGILSEAIAPLCKRLDIVELDIDLQPALIDKFKNSNNVNLIFDNALNISFSNYDKVISSLPYNILEPFIKHVIKCKCKYVFILIGEKYAKSLFFENITSKQNFLNLLTHCFYHVNVYDNISRNNFTPPPRTESMFVEFILAPKEQYVKKRESFLMREIFEQSDKIIKNALIEGLINLYKYKGTQLTKRQSKIILERNNIEQKLLNKKIYELNNDELSTLFSNLKKFLIFIPDKF